MLFAVEAVGYVGRALAYNATGELIPYVLQSTLLLLGPILFAASLYSKQLLDTVLTPMRTNISFL